MKKKQIANLIMVAIIMVIIAAGVLGVGCIRGWFDSDDGSYAMLSEIRGIVNIEREGVSYPAENGTILRSGDKLSCNSGTTAVVKLTDGSLTLSNSAVMRIEEASAGGFRAEVSNGEVFVNTVSAASLSFEGNTEQFSNTVAQLSVRSGAQSVSVFSGTVGDAQAGQMLNWVNGEQSVGKLAIQSLNDFTITQLRNVDDAVTLCFTDADLDALEAERWEEKYGTTPTDPDVTDPTTGTTDSTTGTTDPTTGTTKPTDEPTQPTTKPTVGTEPPVTNPPETTDPPETTSPPETTAPPETTIPPTTQSKKTCTITIRCDTILNNWDNLDPSKAGYVPSNGVILPTVTVEFEEGETVFEVLNRVCSKYGIQIEYSWTPMYNSYYIEGINHLYEFDCGSESGWMYKVNGWFPNYGCSSYELEGNETIVWCYTCVGLGADVGGGNW